MKTLPLTQGKFALVDDEDYEWMSTWKWYACKHRNTWYAQRGQRIKGKQKIFKLHRIILGVTDPEIKVDHIDGNGLNCQKSNMRLCTNKQNVRYQGISKKRNTSGYKGVSWESRRNHWVAQICYNRKNIYLGSFKNIIDAARAYDKGAKEYFGKYARLNFPEN